MRGKKIVAVGVFVSLFMWGVGQSKSRRDRRLVVDATCLCHAYPPLLSSPLKAQRIIITVAICNFNNHNIHNTYSSRIYISIYIYRRVGYGSLLLCKANIYFYFALRFYISMVQLVNLSCSIIFLC
jgi:hypothetical protein